MKSCLLLVSTLLVFSLMLPVAVLANDALLDNKELAQQTLFTDQSSTSRNDQAEASFLTQLITQEVTYQLDPASALKFSCNVASLSGTDLAQDYNQYASTAPDVQVALVVRF